MITKNLVFSLEMRVTLSPIFGGRWRSYFSDRCPTSHDASLFHIYLLSSSGQDDLSNRLYFT